MKKIELTQGFVAVVDDEDYELVSKYKWYVVNRPITNVRYAQRRFGDKMILLHRYILGITNPKTIVDHKNGDGLDCRRENMRVCSHEENMRNRKVQSNNSSGFRGVSYKKSNNKYYSTINVGNRRIHIGCFDTAISAANAYNNYAVMHHGEFARLNVIAPSETKQIR